MMNREKPSVRSFVERFRAIIERRFRPVPSVRGLALYSASQLFCGCRTAAVLSPRAVQSPIC